jgi:hypothetical protein
MNTNAEPFATLVSIDAWRESEGGWSWNQSHKLREFTREDVGPLLEKKNPRELFAYMRREGYLSDASKGRVAIDVSGSDPDYITIQDRKTQEPHFAFIVNW